MRPFTYFFAANDVSPVMAIQRMIGGADNVPLLAIPFFMMLGSILKAALLEAARANGSIIIILMASAGFAWILTWEGVAESVTVMLTEVTASPAMFLLIWHYHDF